MDIYKKIEKIRQKPEKERLRYVWGAVAICMFFLIFIWFFSIKTSLYKADFFGGIGVNAIKKSSVE